MILRRALLAAGLALAIGPAAIAEEVVKIATEGAFAPYNFLDADGAPKGFEVDLGNTVCARLSLSCKWVIVPWDQLRAGLEAGDYDLIMAAMAATPERRAWADFGEDYFGPQGPAQGMFVGTRSFQDPKDGPVAVQEGTIYETWLRAEGYDVRTYPTAGAALAAVLDDKAASTMGSPDHLRPRVFQTGRALSILGTVELDAGGAAAAFVKNSPLRARFDAEMARMRADGSMQEISRKWFGTKEL